MGANSSPTASPQPQDKPHPAETDGRHDPDLDAESDTDAEDLALSDEDEPDEEQESKQPISVRNEKQEASKESYVEPSQWFSGKVGFGTGPRRGAQSFETRIPEFSM